MYTEDELRAFADELQDLWARLEQDITGRICGRIGDIGKLSASDMHALNQLAKIDGDVDAIMRRMAQTLERSEAEVYRLYEEAARADYEFQAGVFEKLDRPVIPFAENAFVLGLIEDAAGVTNGEIRNLTLTTGFTNREGQWEQLAGVYQDTVDYAIMQVRSGATDYHGAMRGAVRKLAGDGLQAIEYDNPGKRYYRRRLDSSVKNAFSGGMQRLSRAQAERTGRMFGADGMEISFHHGARPTHVEMGGKQYPMAEYERSIAPLLEDFNCYHRAFPVAIGVSPPAYSDAELAELKARDAETHVFEGKEYNAYEARQMQRRIETSIRKQKDRAVAFGQTGDRSGEQAALIKGSLLNQKYRQFSRATGLSYKPTRVSAGLNRGQAARLGAQARKLNRLADAHKGLAASLVKIDESTFSRLVPGSKIEDVLTFAGYGSGKELRVRGHLAANYGGKPEQWEHMSGRGMLETPYGPRKGMIHWFYEPSIGVKEPFLKGWSKKK